MSLPAQKARASPPCRIRHRTSVLEASSVRTPLNARSISLVTRLIGPLLIATSAIMRLKATETSGRESPTTSPPKSQEHQLREAHPFFRNACESGRRKHRIPGHRRGRWVEDEANPL